MATAAFSCDCMMTSIEIHIKETHSIVTVKVVELLDTKKERQEYYTSKPDHSYRVKVEVVSVFKGNFMTGQIIELKSEFSNCDIYYKINNEYLLFLEKDEGNYKMKHCSYSEHIDNAGQVMKTLKIELKE